MGGASTASCETLKLFVWTRPRDAQKPGVAFSHYLKVELKDHSCKAALRQA